MASYPGPDDTGMASNSFMGRFSLLQQWAAATTLAIIPLLLAVSYAAYALHQQTEAQRRLVDDMESVSQRGSAVSENIRELVRLSRQYSLLKDPSFLELYRQKLKDSLANVQGLTNILADTTSADISEDIITTARKVEQTLMDNEGISETELSPLLGSLLALNDRLTQKLNEYRKGELERGEKQVQESFNQLFFLAILALPGTFLLMIIGTYMVSKPLWRLSQAIQQLGAQQWEKPITIRGPSDLVELGNNLEWMRQQVVASDRQKTAFLQHVTHDLKTPLAAIIEAGNLLNEEVAGPLESSQRPVLDILRSNARNLEHLIQQLLNYNAVSHGMMTHWQDIDMVTLCQGIRGSLENSQPEKRVNWLFDGSPALIRSDPRLMQMILKNLMGNAFQYVSNNGNIRVHWLQNHHDWDLAISDDGPGFQPDEIDNIYMPFFKGKQSKMASTGVGLAIVHESVSLLKGTIEAYSSPGEGARFYMTFPLVEVIDS